MAADESYSYAFVTDHLTGQDVDRQNRSLPGRELIRDLTQLGEDLSSRLIVDVTTLSDPVWTTVQLAERMSVSRRTISRWCRQGLVGRKFRFPDGQIRVAFNERNIQRFVRRNPALIRRGKPFKRLTTAEKRTIFERARDLVRESHMTVHAVARQIAAETGRAVETVRYTLRQHDERYPDEPIFAPDGRCAAVARYALIKDRLSAGESIEQIAGVLECDVDRVRQVLSDGEVRSLAETKPRYLYNELFDDPNADAVILEVPEPAGATEVKNPPPSTNRAWGLGLWCRAPLLTRKQEVDLFRRYNYLKYKAARKLEKLEPGTPPEPVTSEVHSLMDRADEIRDRLIRCNLRLVISVAKRFSTEPSALSDLLSDGSIALMRAVETFDYARGNKLSTYAVVVIARAVVRTLPAARRRAGPCVTVSDEQLQSVPDNGKPPESVAHAADLRRLLREGLRQLDDRERAVITRRFGLDNNGHGETLMSIGRDYGVTKECIRLVQERALERLRQSLSSPDEEDLLDAA
jgi:RNA polymerase sigma factor (sigma-70 family)